MTCAGGTGACVATLLGPTGLAANGGVAGLPTSINSVVAPFQAAINNVRTVPGVTVGAPPSPYQDSISYNASTFGTRRYPDVRIDFNATKKDTIEFDYHYAWYDSAPDVLNGQDATYPVAPFNTSSGCTAFEPKPFRAGVAANDWHDHEQRIACGHSVGPCQLWARRDGQASSQRSTQTLGIALPVTFSMSGESGLFLRSGKHPGPQRGVGTNS